MRPYPHVAFDNHSTAHYYICEINVTSDGNLDHNSFIVSRAKISYVLHMFSHHNDTKWYESFLYGAYHCYMYDTAIVWIYLPKY